MSNYTITNPALNPKRVFILQKSELENRYDPKFYAKEYKDNLDKIKRNKYMRLGDVVKFSSETWNQKDFFEGTFPYIEISEIDTLSGEIQNISQVEISEAASRAKMLVREYDIIVSTTRPNRGAIALIKKEQDFSIASTGFSVIRNITNSEIERDYLFAILRQQITLKQFEQRSSGGNYPAITQEELSNVIIPFANTEKQQKVIEIFKNCFSQKQTNEAEAEKLLASIEDYLLGELGIKQPEQTYYLQEEDYSSLVGEPNKTYDNYRFVNDKFELNQQNKLVQQKRIFIANFSEVQNKRFDANYHQPKFTNSLNAVFSGEYPVKQLKEIITGNLIKGSLPKQVEKEGECLVVQINSINNDGTISLSDLLTAKPIFTNSQRLIENDVLVVITGATIGKIAFWNYKGEYFLGGDIVKFQTNDFADNSFVYNFLRSGLMQTEIKRNITGATNGHLALSDVAFLPIPVPPLDKQKEIAEHITQIRNQAQELKDKTKDLLKKASAAIEEILLN